MLGALNWSEVVSCLSAAVLIFSESMSSMPANSRSRETSSSRSSNIELSLGGGFGRESDLTRRMMPQSDALIKPFLAPLADLSRAEAELADQADRGVSIQNPFSV